ncbi:hypothetical protein C8R43DRAFT_906266, partial [Mycena crocata]
FGALGYSVIHHTVLDHFPETLISNSLTHLTFNMAIKQVLVLEVITALICSDLNVEYAEAITIFKASTEFGSYYHSDLFDRSCNGTSSTTMTPSSSPSSTCEFPLSSPPPHPLSKPCPSQLE